MIAIPPLQKKLAQMQMKKYCDNKVPKEIQNQIKVSYSIHGNNITLFESRLAYNDKSRWIEMKIAQMRFDNKTKKYTLFCCDQNDKWIHFDYVEPTIELNDLLEVIDNDERGAFWG